jgi:hypothetical protein
MDEPPLTELVDRWSQGLRGAVDELMPLVYAELKRITGAYLETESAPWRHTAGDGVSARSLRLAEYRLGSLLTPGERGLRQWMPVGLRFSRKAQVWCRRRGTWVWWGGHERRLRIYPQSGYVVAVRSNLDPPAGQEVPIPSGFAAAAVGWGNELSERTASLG